MNAKLPAHLFESMVVISRGPAKPFIPAQDGIKKAPRSAVCNGSRRSNPIALQTWRPICLRLFAIFRSAW